MKASSEHQSPLYSAEMATTHFFNDSVCWCAYNGSSERPEWLKMALKETASNLTMIMRSCTNGWVTNFDYEFHGRIKKNAVGE